MVFDSKFVFDVLWTLGGLAVFLTAATLIIMLVWRGKLGFDRHRFMRKLNMLLDFMQQRSDGKMLNLFTVGARVFAAAFCKFVIRSVHKLSRGGWRKLGPLVLVMCLAFIGGLGFRYAFPVMGHRFFFNYIFIGLPGWIVLLLSTPLILYGLRLISHRLVKPGMFVFIFAFMFNSFGGKLWDGVTQWQITQRYAFEQREEMVQVDPEAFPFTPQAVAWSFMIQSYGASEFTLDIDYMSQVDVNGGFGYVVPITPDGIVPTLLDRNPGVVVWNDEYGIPESERIHPVKQTFRYGEDMEWLDNARRKLRMKYFWCEIPEIFYLQLNKDNLEEWTMVAPIVDYKIRFPGVLIPEWGGVVLVDAAGDDEFLDVDAALADTRLDGKPIFPRSLARTLVHAQRFDAGPLSGFYRRAGKIEIPKLPGHTQMPYLIKGKDGRYYYLFAVEPDGLTYALSRFYYVDAHSGKRSVYNFDTMRGIIGPIKGIEYVKTKDRFKWVEGREGAEVGDFRVIQGRPFPQGDILYWVYTVTTKSYTETVATAIVNTTNGNIEFLFERDQFEHWKRTGEIVSAGTDDWQELEGALKKALETQERLREQLQKQVSSSTTK